MSKTILVGSREPFGLEIEVRSREPGIWACVRLWIGGEPLGSEDDPVALYALMGSLDGMLRGSRRAAPRPMSAASTAPMARDG